MVVDRTACQHGHEEYRHRLTRYGPGLPDRGRILKQRNQEVASGFPCVNAASIRERCPAWSPLERIGHRRRLLVVLAASFLLAGAEPADEIDEPR